ncbi:MAG: hypothetical protein JWO38_2678 [Gemmataceae bacterium]|nr:hypothetical protein [Gemmataceae bacterium]
MSASLMVSWRDGVEAAATGDGGVRVRAPGSQVVFRQLTPAVAEALDRLARPGEDEDRLAELVLDAGGPGALAGWYYRLQDLSRRGLVSRGVQVGGRRIATLVPLSPAFTFAPLAPLPDRPHRLSRFAYLRRDGDSFILESPLAHARIVLDDARTVGLIGRLAGPGTPHELAERDAGLPAEAVPPVLSLLAAGGMLSATDPSGTEDEPESLRTWEFHDLLFHTRVRRGRSDAPYGATYRMLGRLDPTPAVKPTVCGETTDLFRPDPDRLGANDPRFAEVVGRRRSIREYGDRPITARQLGEFLYRVARVTGTHETEVGTPHGPFRMGFAGRPYPAGGSLYELEFYAAIHNCDGLTPGLYHYAAGHHHIVRLCGPTADFRQLIADAAASSGIPETRLQILIVLSSRFQRIAWKYASIAYALTLKHVGVVYQTMYLTATAMGLAPCGLGGGDSDLFARVAGTDYYAETSVGEFLLGSRNEAGRA